jgi:hypothetical protein
MSILFNTVFNHRRQVIRGWRGRSPIGQMQGTNFSSCDLCYRIYPIQSQDQKFGIQSHEQKVVPCIRPIEHYRLEILCATLKHLTKKVLLEQKMFLRQPLLVR